MFCGNCGNQMNETEKFCNKCGWRNPLVGSELPAQPTMESAAVTAPVQQTPMQQAPMQQVPVQPVAAPAPQMNVQPVMAAPVNAVPAEKKVSGKKAPMGLFIGIGVAVVAVIILLVFLFTSATVKNWFKKTFSEPEEYYQWVEGNVTSEASSDIAGIYNDYIRESLKIYDTSVNAEVSVQLDEAGKDMLSLAGMGGVDLSWFESANFVGNVSVKDNKVSLSVEESDLLSVIGMMDLAEEAAYLQVPDLNPMYMMLETEDTDYFVEYLDMFKLLYEVSPNKKLIEKILDRYTTLALSCVDDVKLSDASIRAEGVSQDCTELEVTIDEKVIADAAELVLETMKEDEDIKDWMIEAYTALEESDLDMDLDMDAEEVYEEFLDMLDDLQDEADYISRGDFEMEMLVYVDSKGEVCGRTFELGGETIEIIMAHDGSEFGFSATYDMYYDEIALVGSGKDSGGKLTGEFEVEINGMAIVEFTLDKFDVEKLKEGKLQGTITAAPSSALIRGMELSSYASVIGDLSVVIKAESDDNSIKLVCDVMEEDEKWGTVTIALSKDGGKTVKLPSDKNVVEVEDEDDFEDWYDTVDWDAYIEKLEKAEVDKEIIDIVEEISELDVEELLRYLFGYGYYEAYPAEAAPEGYYY